MDKYPAGVEGLVSNSEAKTLLRCEQQYYYKFILNLRPRRPAAPLRRGGWMHELLHAHYAGGDWKAKHSELTKEYNRMFDEEKEFYGDLPTECGRIMSNYLWTWKEEPWRVLEAEYDFPPRKFRKGWAYRGKVDLIVKDRQGTWLVEHKTASRMPPGEVRLMDPQTHRYFWALEGKFDLTGVIFNYLRSKPPTIPERLKSGELTRRASIDTTPRTYLSAIKAYGLNPDDYQDVLADLRHRPSAFCWRYRVSRNPVIAQNFLKDLSMVTDRIIELRGERRPIRTIDFRCHMDCDYRDLCLVELGGGRGEPIIKGHFTMKGESDGTQEDFSEEF